MFKRIKYLFLIFLTGTATSLFSQTQGTLGKRFFDNWSAGIGAGPDIFFGDLKVHQFWPANNNMNEWKFGGTFTLTRQLSHVFAIRGQFLYSELSGTKRQYKNGTPCNEYFDGNLLEVNINTTINFSNLLASRYNPRRKFFIYGTIGLGTSSYNTNVKQLGTGLPLRRSDSLGNWTTVAMGMAGIGAYVNLGDKVNLGVEWTLHGVNTDWLDDTQGGFHYDAYSMVAVSITYNFNKRNPGKEPDTNRKIYLPVYIQIPAKDILPVVTKPPAVVPEKDTTFMDTLSENFGFPEEKDTADVFTGEPEKGLTFRVQIFAFRNDKYSALEIREKYNLEEVVSKEFSDGWYRFTIGSFSSYADAIALREQVQKRRFRDAFVARYKDGVRFSAHGKK